MGSATQAIVPWVWVRSIFQPFSTWWRAQARTTDVMVELDPSPDGPMTPLQTVQTTKAYLEKLGYKFRS